METRMVGSQRFCRIVLFTSWTIIVVKSEGPSQRSGGRMDRVSVLRDTKLKFLPRTQSDCLFYSSYRELSGSRRTCTLESSRSEEDIIAMTVCPRVISLTCN